MNFFAHDPEFGPKLNICVAGGIVSGSCGIDASISGKELGRAIARAGAVIMTGTAPGFPLWAAMGAKEAGGFSVGFSPAANEREHAGTYRLPLECSDAIVYTGFGFTGRNLLLARSADAVLVGCGRIGAINEFTIAFEEKKPIGILEGPWTTDEVVERVIEAGHRTHGKIVFDSDPQALVRRVIALIGRR